MSRLILGSAEGGPKIISSGLSMAASWASAAIDLMTNGYPADKTAIQVDYTNANTQVGSCKLQYSNKLTPGTDLTSPDWIDADEPEQAIPQTNNGAVGWLLDLVGARWVRVIFTSSSTGGADTASVSVYETSRI